MKKIAVLILGIVTSLSLYAVPQSNTGAGLGTQIFAGEDGLASQVLAVTTNGTLGNQTFAITSGTLGATKPDSFVNNQRIDHFVADNMDNLASDIAVGSGESLATLMTLMEVDAAQQAAVSKTLKANFATIYSSDAVTHQDVIKAISDLIKA